MNSYFILGIGLICVVISAIAVFIFVKRLRENKAQTSDILRQQRRDMHELTSFLQTEASVSVTLLYISLHITIHYYHHV